MPDHPSQKPLKTLSRIVSVGVLLNLLETLITGLFVWVSIEISDPVFGPSFNLDAYYKQTKHEILILVLSNSLYAIIFLGSFLLWKKGKRFWGIILSSLALFQLIGINWLLTYYLGATPLLFLLFLAIIFNLPVPITVFIDMYRSRRLINSQSA